MTNSCISLPALCTTKVTVSPRFSVSCAGSKRMRSLIVTRTVRVAFFGSPWRPQGCCSVGDRRGPPWRRRGPRHGPRRPAAAARPNSSRLEMRSLQCLCPPRGLTARQGAPGWWCDFGAVGVGGRRALRVHRLAGPFVGHAALGVRIPARVAVVVARQALAHLDHREHAAHLQRRPSGPGRSSSAACCRAAASPSRPCRPCRARPSPCSRAPASGSCAPRRGGPRRSSSARRGPSRSSCGGSCGSGRPSRRARWR